MIVLQREGLDQGANPWRCYCLFYAGICSVALLTVEEQLWFEVQSAAEDAVQAAKAVAHRTNADKKLKAALVTAAAAGGVAWYCTCTPSGRKAAKGLFNAGRSRLAKWIAPAEQEKVHEPCVMYDVEVGEVIADEPVSILDL